MLISFRVVWAVAGPLPLPRPPPTPLRRLNAGGLLVLQDYHEPLGESALSRKAGCHGLPAVALLDHSLVSDTEGIPEEFQLLAEDLVLGRFRRSDLGDLHLLFLASGRPSRRRPSRCGWCSMGH